MPTVELSAAEISSIQGLLQEIAENFETVEAPEFLLSAAVYAHELPRRVRAVLNEFRLKEPKEGICIIRGYPIDDDAIGDTPSHWKVRQPRSPEFKEEAFLVLLGSLLGDLIAWSTQQDGHVVHDILPIRGHEGEQLGSSSEQLLWWHTEDAFHPCRGDYLGMMCLRNPTQVPTTFASLENVSLDLRQRELLFEPHFAIRPDESHLKKNKGNGSGLDDLLSKAYSQMESWNSEPEKISVLYGDRESPYIRIDPYFMDPVENKEAQQALDTLIQALEGELRDVVLQPGDVVIIDNFKGVHGRKPFRAQYNGRDRWLKRINIARDLRRSREARRASEERIIF
ncbi:MAG TPA: guanitoxin biosynthesis L-enduracididine beta-hydroxylase GntD [Thermoanaerobaculia bacterium]|nr:guanitoxin biosynthesis L-enduracididine beta-hydroxylase GntD [Thermoanaerobaculia bacterium]